MRECQLCGAKSWGPLTTTETKWVQDRAAEVVPSSRLASLRECDACGSIADESVISKPVSVPELRLGEFPHIADAIFGGPSVSRGPDPMTVAKEALESMASRMPMPETRLERIVRAIISAHRGSWPSPISIVGQALAIEQEMSKAKS